MVVMRYEIMRGAFLSVRIDGEKRRWFQLLERSRDGQRYSKMYRLKQYRYAIFEKKIV